MVDSQAGAPAYGIGAGEGCAPGRLDFIGGVSDYSGAVVLQAAISLETRVKIEYIHDDLGLRERRMIEVRSEQFGDNEPVALDLNEIENCAKRGLSQVKTYLAVQDSPKWASYVIGTLCAFCNHKQCWPQQGSIRISVDSDVPHGEGVSSSAALEIAVLRALEDHFNLFTPKEDLPGLAELAQQAENEVVGAPCGIMDQITCLCGSHGAVLPIDCAARTMSEEIFLPSGVFIVGFPTKVQHTLTGHPPGTSPYERARTATAMAAKIVQAEVLPALKTLTDISTVSLPKFDKEIKPKLPASMKGRDFLAKYGSIEEVDAMSVVVPGEEYPLLDAMEFAVQGSFFAKTVLSLLEASTFAEGPLRETNLELIGEIMVLQHQSYSKIGLGHVLTDTIVDLLMSFGPEKGIYGARASGAGSGGIICVLCDEKAMTHLEDIADEYKTSLIL